MFKGKKLWLIIGLFAVLLIGGIGYVVYQSHPRPELNTKFVQNERQEEIELISSSETAVDIEIPGNYVLLDNPGHTYQTFNNCGPATLSMILSWYGINVSQAELGNLMRPYQNPQGDNDDKTILTSEFVDWTKKYGLGAVGRVNGDIELLKKFTASGIPVVVKTWLHPGEDIGHFRIVRGFDEPKQVIIQDDSYEGPNRKIPYYDFLSMWQPFNYSYIIVYQPETEEKVAAILASEHDESVAWQNAVNRAGKEGQLDPENVYPVFNIATAAFHLGDFKKSVEAFAEVENRLPRRMLWYQIEPILAYQELGDYDRVFEITDRIISNGNRAFSELYFIRGEIYLDQGKVNEAKKQFGEAIKYNEHYDPPKDKLKEIGG